VIAMPSWNPARASVQGVWPRLRQVRRHAFASNHQVDIPQGLARFLVPVVEAGFHMLRTSDQEHLIAVAESLARCGASDDLVTAGLLHDIGKAAPGITIRLTDRFAKVLVECAAPNMLTRPASQRQPPRIGATLWVLAGHAEAGAELAGRAGYNERMQWLIANHDRKGPIEDPGLQLLIAADKAGGFRSTQ